MQNLLDALKGVPGDIWIALRFLARAFATEAVAFWSDMGKHPSEIYPSDKPDEDETARWW